MININKENIQKYFIKGAAFTLAVTMMGSFVGCSKKDDSLSESDVVAIVDGKYQVLRTVYPEYCMDYGDCYKGWWVDASYYPQHEHYLNLNSGNYLTTSEYCHTIVMERGIITPVSIFNGPKKVKHVEDLAVVGPIADFITDDELKSLKENGITDEDSAEIISRIQLQTVDVTCDKKNYTK